jgi:ketosteroid isomerase-like protein
MIDPVGLLKDYHAALNAFDLSSVEMMLAEDAVYLSPGLSGEMKGRAAILNAMRLYFAEFSDQVSTDEYVRLVGPDTAQSNWQLVATSGLTGKKISRSGIEKVTFDSNKLIMRVEVIDQD